MSGYRIKEISPSQHNIEKILHHFPVNIFREQFRQLCFLPVCIPAFALIILLFSPEPRPSFIVLLIPVTLITFLAGIKAYTFIGTLWESMQNAFLLMLEMKGSEGIKKEAGITDRILHGFPGYISIRGSWSIEYAYTFISETHVYVTWRHRITKKWVLLQYTHEQLCSSPGRVSPLLAFMFDQEYTVKYKNLVWISDHVRMLEQCLYPSSPS